MSDSYPEVCIIDTSKVIPLSEIYKDDKGYSTNLFRTGISSKTRASTNNQGTPFKATYNLSITNKSGIS